MKNAAIEIAGLLCISLCAAHCALGQTSTAAQAQIRRGEYLVGYGGCGDCHTPKVMTPSGPVPDKARLLSGHQANEPLPPVPAEVGAAPGKWGAVTNANLTAWAGPWGVSFAANLTPDAQTGMGSWTPELFIKTMRTGRHFGGGRPLLPPMPWTNAAGLTDQDLRAVFAYLRSLKPIQNRVPAPLPPK